MNTEEVGKEIFGNVGYSDGSRFMSVDNPQVAQLQMQLQQTMQLVQALQAKLKEKQVGHMVKLQASREANTTHLQKAAMHEANENKRALATHFRALMEANGKQTAKELQ